MRSKKKYDSSSSYFNVVVKGNIKSIIQMYLKNRLYVLLRIYGALF